MDTLAARFDSFLDAHPRLGAQSPAIISRLQTDLRMQTAWKSLIRHDRTGETFSETLKIILQLEKLVNLSPKLRNTLEQIERERNEVSIALARILTFLVQFKDEDIGNIVNPMIRSNVEILQFAELYTEALGKRLEVAVTSSQKDGYHHVHFANLLCRLLTKNIGRPLYGFVATVASVVYQTDEEISIEAVRLAFKRDNERRATSVVKRTV